ncbi:type VII secretion integral membrane protein EccD, partial [Mycobacterium sp. 1245852.3]
MTSGTVMPIVRVAILADSRLTEMALPAELPLREILPAVQRLVVPAAVNGDSEDGTATRGAAEVGAATQLSLAPIGGAPFSLDASLDTVGVVDGDLLALQAVPVGPAAPGIVEDIADAAMIFSASRLKPWGTTHIQRGALAAAIAVAFLATGLSVTYRVATGALLGLVAVSAVAALTAIVGLLVTARSARTGMALSIAALVPIAAALALAVPGRFGPAQLTLAAAGVTAWSLIALMAPSAERERIAGFFTATAVVGGGVLLAAGAELLWHLTPIAIGCGLIVAALLVTIEAAQLSALWARFPLPVIPAPGDPTPSAPSLQVLEDLPRRVRISDAHQSGFIAAAVLLSVLGSVAIGLRPESLSVAGWYVIAATAATSVLRARVWDSAACKAWLLAQPFLTAGVLLVLYTSTGRYAAALGAALVLLALVSMWIVVALNPGIAWP